MIGLISLETFSAEKVPWLMYQSHCQTGVCLEPPTRPMPALQDTRHGASRVLLLALVDFGVGTHDSKVSERAGVTGGTLHPTRVQCGLEAGLGWWQVAVFLLSITRWRAGSWFCLFSSSLFKNSFTVITALLTFERQVSTF